MDFTAGIDVGGDKKGFHLALIGSESPEFHSFYHVRTPADAVKMIRAAEKTLNGRCLAIGIDAPRKASRCGKESRKAEKSVRSLGYRLIWTPQAGSKRYDWMENGERLWTLLQKEFPDADLLECFPSMLSDQLNRLELLLPAGLFTGYHKRNYYKDYLDSALCAALAGSHILKKTHLLGPEDEQGPIAVLSNPVTRQYVLCIIHSGDRILLGMKKKGFGEGKWNGFGGKIEAFDRGRSRMETLENAVRREIREECGLEALKVHHRGKIYFTFYDNQDLLEVDVFRCSDFTGEIAESDEMVPRWFAVSEIPYESMWKDDPVWLPVILNDQSFRAYFFFQGENLVRYTMEIL